MKKFLFSFFLLVTISGISQEKKLALVIGNSAYEHGGRLNNPVNDAMAMTEALMRIGFEVMDYYDLDYRSMKMAIDSFGFNLQNYEVGLFFYAGHGIQSKGRNYLIPVEANIKSEQQVEYDCVEAGRVMAQMDASGADVKIVILDACRNNPFERSWTRSVSGQGLAFMAAPKGTLIAYATSPGSTASDGDGQNGPYTSAILENITISNITIIRMFQNVRRDVIQNTNGEQIPWESTSLIGDFYFTLDLSAGLNDIGINEEKNPVLVRTGKNIAWKIANVQVQQQGADRLNITYELQGSTIYDLFDIDIEYTNNNDGNRIELNAVSGDVGNNIIGGKDSYSVVWDVFQDVESISNPEFFITGYLVGYIERY